MSKPISALEIARALIRCPSVTPQDAGSQRVLERILGAAGFAVAIVTFEEPGTAPIKNLYARLGDASPCLLFAGHTDVVPPGDAAAWRFDPFSGEIADGELWGRGAVDMKGGVAASVAAVLAFLEKRGQPAGSIAFLITGDEEGPAVNGTTKLLAWAKERGERFDHCVLGEPTNPDHLGDMIKIGRRGSLNGAIAVHGRLGHVAYPHLADNPIPALMRLATALKATPLDAGTRHFDPSNLEITTVDVGNTASNVIPADARARFNVRFNDMWTPESLLAELRRRCESVAEGARYTLTLDPCNATAFMTQPGPFTDLVAAAVLAETGRTPALSTTGGTSDARFIRAHCPVVEFGLVGRTMHAVDERVTLKDLEVLEAVYKRILDLYFKSDGAGT